MRHLLPGLLVGIGLLACSDSSTPSPITPPSWSVSSSTAGAGGATTGGGATSAVGSGGAGGTGGAEVAPLDAVLTALRADPEAGLASVARERGWPVAVEGGYLVATTAADVDRVAGDFDGWVGTPLTPDDGFAWVVVPASPGDGYKLHDGGSLWRADPWARAYRYDDLGELSLIAPSGAHLERFFDVSDANHAPRRVRVYVPAGPPTHVLYLADGQNLFDPAAPWGGWNLDEDVPPAMMLVGVDHSPARMDEYTHVFDDIGGGPIGGAGDAYAAFLHVTVRGLVEERYGEAEVVGVMGSSLGGLISLHVAQRYPGAYDFAASLSGTLGWGSIGAGVAEETMIERWATAAPGGTAVYLDSGGGGTCVDTDGDGLADDGVDKADNYCETLQMRDTLEAIGFVHDVDLWHWWEPGAPHHEAAWAARVWRPLEHFAAQ